VAWARRDIRTEVFPEEAREEPQISVKAPTGMPPRTESILPIPVEIVFSSERLETVNASGIRASI
jgi:hypothetical protein